MAVSEATVLDALRAVRDPDLHKDIVALKFVKDVRIVDDRVSFTIELTTPACPVKIRCGIRPVTWWQAPRRVIGRRDHDRAGPRRRRRSDLTRCLFPACAT